MATTTAAGGFVFEPRKLASSPRQFGKTSMALTPVEGLDAEEPRFQAAILQHLVTNTVRECLAAAGTTLHEWVNDQPATPGLSYDRLVRIQRGETMMQLADLFYWSSQFDAVGAVFAGHDFGSPDRR